MSFIFLGNLRLEELEEKHSFKMTDEDKDFLNSFRQNDADVKEGDKKFHISDIPRIIVCGTNEMAQIVYNILRKYPIKGQLEIGSKEQRK